MLKRLLIARCCNLLLICTSAVAGGLHDPQPGKLVYADGDLLQGSLVAEGVFQSDRFGEITFNSHEATFDPLQVADQALPQQTWWPDRFGVGGTASWKEEDEKTESRVALELELSWKRPSFDHEFDLRGEYKIRNEQVDSNEQSMRLRHYQRLTGNWLGVGMAYAERDSVKFLGLDFDYLLLQGSFGPGYEFKWKDHGHTRVALLAERFRFELRDLDLNAYENATTLFIDNQFDLTDRLSLSNWLHVYLWENADTGLESETELGYAVTKDFRVGLRHKYLKSGVVIQFEKRNELQLFSRVRF